jgi:hypothetical protein
VRAAGDELGGVALLHPLGQDEDADVGPLVADQQGGAQALVGERGWHPHVHHADVRPASATARRNVSASPAAATISWPASSRSRVRPLRSRTESSAIATRTHGSTAEMIVGPPDGDSTNRSPSTPARRSARPDRPGAGRVGPADAVIADHDVEGAGRTGTTVHGHARVAGAGVLGDVGERLGDGEVRDRLHGGPRPDRHVDLDGDRDGAARGEAGQRRVEAAVGEHRRVDAADQFAELDEGGLGLGVRLVDEGGRGVNVVGELRLRPAEFHRDGDEPLLRAVVQVPLDPPALGLGRVHHPLPADLKLGDPRLEPRVTRRGQEPAGEGGVGGREPPGERGGREQDQEAGNARQRKQRRAAVEVVPVDRGAAAGELSPVQREGEAGHACGPDHDRQREGDEADRQAEHRVGGPATRDAAGERGPLRDEQRPVAAGRVGGPGGDLGAKQEGEPGPFHGRQPVGEPGGQAEDGQADERERQQRHPAREAGHDDRERGDRDDKADHVVYEGEPGARRHQAADEEHTSDARRSGPSAARRAAHGSGVGLTPPPIRRVTPCRRGAARPHCCHHDYVHDIERPGLP